MATMGGNALVVLLLLLKKKSGDEDAKGREKESTVDGHKKKSATELCCCGVRCVCVARSCELESKKNDEEKVELDEQVPFRTSAISMHSFPTITLSRAMHWLLNGRTRCKSLCLLSKTCLLCVSWVTKLLS